jgi:hypothetical protein
MHNDTYAQTKLTQRDEHTDSLNHNGAERRVGLKGRLGSLTELEA